MRKYKDAQSWFFLKYGSLRDVLNGLLKSEYHANDPLHAYVYVLCLSPTELYISDHI